MLPFLLVLECVSCNIVEGCKKVKRVRGLLRDLYEHATNVQLIEMNGFLHIVDLSDWNSFVSIKVYYYILIDTK